MTDQPLFKAFPAIPSAIPAARSWVTLQLRGLGVSDDAVERARLLVTELTVNVVRHTTSDQFAVRLSVHEGVEVGVHDEDSVARPESRREPRLLDLGGRGMMVISTVADAWGVELTEAGKWVRVLIDEAPVTDAPASATEA